MAEAIIKGLLSSKFQITVSEIAAPRRAYLKKTFSQIELIDNNQKAVEAEVVVLAVKPQDIPQVIAQLKIAPTSLVISIAAGVTIRFLEKAFANCAVVRAMPNNPALIGAGITALAKGKRVKPEQFELAAKIFKTVGEVVIVAEKDMDTVTGLSGSGPAYVYLMIEALAEAGERLGLPTAEAQKLARQTVFGSAKTMLETGKSARELKEMVTSPGGTTIEGLKVLEKKKFVEAVIEAVQAAAARSKKLSQ